MDITASEPLGRRALQPPHYTFLKVLLGLQWWDCNEMPLLQGCKHQLIKPLNFSLIRKYLSSCKIATKTWLLMVQEKCLGQRTNRKTKMFCCSNPFPVTSVSCSCPESLIFISGSCLQDLFFFSIFLCILYNHNVDIDGDICVFFYLASLNNMKSSILEE